MTAQILDGKKLATEITHKLADKLSAITANKRPPGLAVILVGQEPASALYVEKKCKACEQAGILSLSIELPDNTLENELITHVERLNLDPTIDGILVQLPLPPHIRTEKIIEAIHPDKDVDGFHPYNIGRLAKRLESLQSCTPKGICKLLKSAGIELRGKDVLIVGASNIVGRPLGLLMLLEGATVTICHRFTKNLPEKVSQADIIIAAVGKPELIKGNWIKHGAVVVDVGINRTKNGQIIGDIEFSNAKLKASWITPVPGGVGPMTVASLLENTFLSYCKRESIPID